MGWSAFKSDGVEKVDTGQGYLGRQLAATPRDFYITGIAYSTAENLAASGGAGAVAIAVTAPMYLQQFVVYNQSTAVQTAEARLYKDIGTNILQFIPGTDATFSYTGSGGSTATAAVSGAPVLLYPGEYWLVIRNTHASNSFQLYRDSNPNAGVTWHSYYRTNPNTISALGATIDLDTNWTSFGVGIAVWMEGRTRGRSSV